VSLTEKSPARGYLLDTHAAIFSISQSRSLSSAAKAAIAEGPNFLSVVSYWEVMGDPRAWWFEALNELAATPLTLRPEHIAAIYSLPPAHRDPFDRILIAQAIAEGLVLVSADAEISRYASKSLKIIG
jgi:PIN domain nuclease of toxin-antitoxin system